MSQVSVCHKGKEWQGGVTAIPVRLKSEKEKGFGCLSEESLRIDFENRGAGSLEWMSPSEAPRSVLELFVLGLKGQI